MNPDVSLIALAPEAMIDPSLPMPHLVAKGR
ncbi:hypothetical protein CBM2634_B170074 [Cupriavidus taiwanensis]|uniref:Uncharacterized protein n=1 Tax=Cupriavidus taiwanensis TaxID=164546 RepID=A0A375J6K6_9BURK|nr:hypothetical protein CBM2634_B170074 [Cupriavidus taiwanensis]